jgi:hypothetical protein
MAWLAVALSFVGLLVMAAVKPDDTRAYFDLVGIPDAVGSITILVTTAMLTPNMATIIAAGAMGGSFNLSALGSSCGLLSYGGFPLRALDAAPAGEDFNPLLGGNLCDAFPVDFGVAPAAYFLFLLVPIMATVLGGYLAARRAGTLSSGEAMLAGAAAAPVYAFFLLAFMVMAEITVKIGGPFAVFLGGGGVGAGPGLLVGTLLALLWGVAGGALGGLVAHRRAAPSTPPPAPASALPRPPAEPA